MPLKDIRSPEDLKRLPKDMLPLLADELRQTVI